MTPPPAPPQSRLWRGAPRAITVPPQAYGLNKPIITAPGRLCGWSLIASSGYTNSVITAGVYAAAAAAALSLTNFAAISTVTVTPAGAWPAGSNLVTLSSVLSGPLNRYIPGGTESPVVFSFSPALGANGTPQVSVPAIAGGPAYSIDASGETLVGGATGYTDQAGIYDGGQLVAAVSAQPGYADTFWASDEGIYIGTSLAFNASQGGLSGVIYWRDDWNGGDN